MKSILIRLNVSLSAFFRFAQQLVKCLYSQQSDFSLCSTTRANPPERNAPQGQKRIAQGSALGDLA